MTEGLGRKLAGRVDAPRAPWARLALVCRSVPTLDGDNLVVDAGSTDSSDSRLSHQSSTGLLLWGRSINFFEFNGIGCSHPVRGPRSVFKRCMSSFRVLQKQVYTISQTKAIVNPQCVCRRYLDTNPTLTNYSV